MEEVKREKLNVRLSRAWFMGAKDSTKARTSLKHLLSLPNGALRNSIHNSHKCFKLSRFMIPFTAPVIFHAN